MSAVKRKREEVDVYPSKMDWSRSAIRTVTTGIQAIELSRAKSIYLLSEGSLLVIEEDHMILYADVLNRGIAELKQQDYTGLSEAHSFSTELLIPTGGNVRHLVRDSGSVRRTREEYPEIVCVSPAGSVQFWQPRKNGQHVTSSFAMLLADVERDEYIRDIVFEDRKVYMLSSLNNIYLVHRNEDNEVQGFVFQRSISLIAGLWKTGARLLGVDSEEQVANSLKLITVPQRSLLLNIGSKVTIWSNYTSPRKENVLLEIDLSTVLKTDIAKALGVPSYSFYIQLLDAALISIADKTADLFVLSAHVHSTEVEEQIRKRLESGQNTDDDDIFSGVSATLHLHHVQFALSKSSGSSGSASDSPGQTDSSSVLIRRRYNIANNVLIPGGKSPTAPKIATMAPGWRVFITWIDGRNQQVSAMQLDTFHGSDVASVHEIYDATKGPSAHAMNGRINWQEIGDVAHISKVDGCILVHSIPPQVTLFTPPLTIPTLLDSRKQEEDEDMAVDNIEERDLSIEGHLEGLALQRASAKVFETLTDIIAHKADLFSHLGELRNSFLQLPASALAHIVEQVSEGIINRNPTGRYWGSSLSFRGKSVDNKVHELQFAHRIVADKVLCHGQLMQIIWEIYGFRHKELDQLLSLNQDRAALAAAVAESIENRMPLIHEDEHVKTLLEEMTTMIEESVLALGKQSLEDIQAKGLTPYDQFYADVSKVFEFFTDTVQRFTRGISTAHWSPVLGVHLLHMIVDIFRMAEAQGTQAFHEAHMRDSSHSGAAAPTLKKTAKLHLLLRHIPLRDALVQLIAAIVPEVESRTQGQSDRAAQLFAVLASSTISSVSSMPVGKRGFGATSSTATASSSIEETWIAQCIDLILSAYVREAVEESSAAPVMQHIEEMHMNSAVESMSRVWKQDYESAKAVCIKLLLVCHHHARAFQFSNGYWYFEGLFAATAMAPEVHKARLNELIQEYGHIRNSAVDYERTLVRQYLEWLERHNQLQRLLLDTELLIKLQGKSAFDVKNRQMIDAFLTGIEVDSARVEDAVDEDKVASTKVPYDPYRHHVHMLQGLRRKDYLTTAHAALAHASSLSVVGERKSVLSFGKLAAIVATRKAQEVPSSSSSSSSTALLYQKQCENALKLPVIQELYCTATATSGSSDIDNEQLLSPIALAHRIVQHSLVPLIHSTILSAANPAQALQDHRQSLLARISHILIVLGCHHDSQRNQTAAGTADKDQVTRLLSTLWEEVVRIECIALEDAVLYQGPVTRVQEEAMVKDISILAAVVQDGLTGVKEGNLPIDFLWPVATAGSNIGFESILQQVIAPAATATSTPHPVVTTWKKAEQERAQLLIHNIIRLVQQ